MPSSFTQILNMSRSGMLTRLSDLDVVSNNLANVNTTGFKRSRSNFQELLDSEQLNGNYIGNTQHIMDQASLHTSTNPLDVAIQGEGFFGINLPDGRVAYTRDGQFYLDANRKIVNASGFELQWEGEIPEGTEEVHVNPDGSVMTRKGDEWSKSGTIQINRFPNPGGLMGYGQNLWLETDVSGAVQTTTPGMEGTGTFIGGALEYSNVNMAEQMVEMINLQRSFQLSLRTFQQTDQMLSLAINVRR